MQVGTVSPFQFNQETADKKVILRISTEIPIYLLFYFI